MKVSYSDKLKDPRWQKKRLEILQRDGFTCLACHSQSKTLHVHHCYYVGRRDPWDYPDASLLTFCEKCHGEVDDQQTSAGRWALSWEKDAVASNTLSITHCFPVGGSPSGWVLSKLAQSENTHGFPALEAGRVLNDALTFGVLNYQILDALNTRCSLVVEAMEKGEELA